MKGAAGMDIASFLLLLLAPMGCGGQGTGVGREVTTDSSFTFHVVNSSGHEIPDYAVAAFRDGRTGADFASRFRGLHAAAIPRGTYSFTLNRGTRGGGTRTGRVDVNCERVSLTIAGAEFSGTGPQGRELAIDFIRRPAGPIRFKLVPTPAHAEEMRVRFEDVFQAWATEAGVGPDGSFTLCEPPHGAFVAMILSGSRVVAMQLIEIGERQDGNGIVEIPMPTSPPDVLRIPDGPKGR
jgi:hypothetical protein